MGHTKLTCHFYIFCKISQNTEIKITYVHYLIKVLRCCYVLVATPLHCCLQLLFTIVYIVVYIVVVRCCYIVATPLHYFLRCCYVLVRRIQDIYIVQSADMHVSASYTPHQLGTHLDTR